jgi:histidyl-tRNA synthetase
LIFQLLAIKDVKMLRAQFEDGSEGAASLDEMDRIFNYLDGLTLKNKVEFDITLARGIGYYTGCIFEVAALKRRWEV